jgi:hypothetical protein
MLDDAPRYGHQLVVSWLPHGKAFLIHDRPFFASNIMPFYFKSKFTSFRQLLRNHGFAQMGGNGWDEGSYYHKVFIRDDPSLCRGLTQQQMKEAMPDWIPASEEPDFYSSFEDAPVAVATVLSLPTISTNSENSGSSLSSSEKSGRAEFECSNLKSSSNMEPSTKKHKKISKKRPKNIKG